MSPTPEPEEVGSKSGGIQKEFLRDILERIADMGRAFEKLMDRIGIMENKLSEISGMAKVQDMSEVVKRLTSLEVWRGELKGRTTNTAILVSGAVSLAVMIIGGLVVFFLTRGAR